ncbi:hypothetical protein H2201_007610 [Coniosporium apollinis]|uniref:C2H2-type domain-containing protein n=2 Tax=Coniosporium TaxID=2810619 RepID=A0ABQ9NJ73_9PEZI|nr:hypothetical protein H2199_006317 [Cladosporium sp. JES 115]KAJ9658829.1 hypothetical protein H2201_007610 [Coniosporium apollinis]
MNPALRAAIETATPERLRAVLESIRAESSAAHDLVTAKLLLGEADSTDRTTSEDEGTQAGGSTAEKRKTSSKPKQRPRPRYAICEHCGKEFDVTSNGADDCVWHDGTPNDYGLTSAKRLLASAAGRLEANEDAFVDMEEETWGPHEDYKEEFPENFNWTCCQQDGTTEGCNVERHEERPDAYKRARRSVTMYSILRSAIDTSTHERLYKVLVAICKKSPIARELVSLNILLDEADSTDRSIYSDDKATNGDEVSHDNDATGEPG